MLLPAWLFPRNTFAFSAADAERAAEQGCGREGKDWVITPTTGPAQLDSGELAKERKEGGRGSSSRL